MTYHGIKIKEMNDSLQAMGKDLCLTEEQMKVFSSRLNNLFVDMWDAYSKSSAQRRKLAKLKAAKQFLESAGYTVPILDLGGNDGRP